MEIRGPFINREEHNKWLIYHTLKQKLYRYSGAESAIQNHADKKQRYTNYQDKGGFWLEYIKLRIIGLFYSFEMHLIEIS